ncbi:hypothetical protein KY340_00895 [Candidatus Woesearchaeota archaeon]|nr:hypothetical protein [Candidatus Woesearchaeota archaeon]
MKNLFSSRKTSIILVLFTVIFLLIIPFAAAQQDVFTKTLGAVHTLMENKPLMFAMLFFLFFFLLYAIFALGLSRSKAFADEGKLKKNGKIVALTLSGIVVLSVFFSAGPGQVLIRAREIAHQFNILFAVFLAILICGIFRYLFDDVEIGGKNIRNFMTLFGLGFALIMFGTLGDRPMFTGIGTALATVLVVIAIFYLIASMGGEEDEVHYNIRAAIPRDYNDRTDEERNEVRTRIRNDLDPIITGSMRDLREGHDRLTNASGEIMENTRNLQNEVQQLIQRNEQLSQRMAAREAAEENIRQLTDIRDQIRDLVRRMNVFNQNLQHTMREKNSTIENGVNQFNDELAHGTRDAIGRTEERLENAINEALDYITNKDSELTRDLTTKYEELHHLHDQLLDDTEDLDRRTRE